MPTDPNLYGQRTAKKLKRGTTLASSLDFTAQLTSLMADVATPEPSSAAKTRGRPRPGRQPREDLGNGPGTDKKLDGRKKEAKLVLKDLTSRALDEEEEAELERAKQKLEMKARRYAALKRGDQVEGERQGESLVDFDRKWAERKRRRGDGEAADGGFLGLRPDPSSDLDSDSDSEAAAGEEDGAADEVVEWDDEFGRRRRGTRAEQRRMERRQRRGQLGAEAVDGMSARPRAPARLIYGDTIQASAFQPDNEEKMEALARKRDRSATPPEQKHYDADKEVRTKGVGFYKFSKEEERRRQEMQSLDQEREQTERARQRRHEERASRRQALDARRDDMGARRAQRQADSFLDRLDARGGD